MKSERIIKALGAVNEEYVDDAMSRTPVKKRPVWIKYGATAACLCMLALSVFALSRFNLSDSQSCPANNSDPSLYPESEGDGITYSEKGITIPPMDVSLSADNSAAADMLGFFIYEGRCYVQYEWISDESGIVGEYLGTATGFIDEWTPKEGYVDFAGSVNGDFYAVNGFDPSFILCMKYGSGDISTFINNNGITLKTGADLFEDRLHLSGNYGTVEYQTRNDWFKSIDNIYELGSEHTAVLEDFISALNEGSFMPISSSPLTEDGTSAYDKEIYHMFFHMENGMTVHLRLFEGGFVRFQGLNGCVVKVDDGAFKELVNSFEH